MLAGATTVLLNTCFLHRFLWSLAPPVMKLNSNIWWWNSKSKHGRDYPNKNPTTTSSPVFRLSAFVSPNGCRHRGFKTQSCNNQKRSWVKWLFDIMAIAGGLLKPAAPLLPQGFYKHYRLWSVQCWINSMFGGKKYVSLSHLWKYAPSNLWQFYLHRI